jgi:hypothetical protein
MVVAVPAERLYDEPGCLAMSLLVMIGVFICSLHWLDSYGEP